MPTIPMAQRLAAILARDPELAFEFYTAASEIVDDFEDWGPVIQADESGAYSSDATIMRLKRARDAVIERLRAPQST